MRFPEAWLLQSGLAPPSGARLAAVLHVYYPELLEEIISHLASIPVAFDLIVTSATGPSPGIDATRLPLVQRHLSLEVENRGRDLWPLLQVVNAGLLDSYDLVLKTHTKRSDWRADHDSLEGTGGAWRTGLLSALLGDPVNVQSILDAFRDLEDLGILTADGSVLGSAFWGQDRPATASLMRRLDLGFHPRDLVFAAGSMYWIRAIVLRRLRDLRMSREDFEAEDDQVDGTTAHALERVIGLLTTQAGLRIVERSDLAAAADAPQ